MSKTAILALIALIGAAQAAAESAEAEVEIPNIHAAVKHFKQRQEKLQRALAKKEEEQELVEAGPDQPTVLNWKAADDFMKDMEVEDVKEQAAKDKALLKRKQEHKRKVAEMVKKHKAWVTSNSEHEGTQMHKRPQRRAADAEATKQRNQARADHKARNYAKQVEKGHIHALVEEGDPITTLADPATAMSKSGAALNADRVAEMSKKSADAFKKLPMQAQANSQKDLDRKEQMQRAHKQKVADMVAQHKEYMNRKKSFDRKHSHPSEKRLHGETRQFDTPKYINERKEPRSLLQKGIRGPMRN